MPSLTTHVRRREDHDRLPFHPNCPICRDRVAGVLASEGLVSRRTRAALTAGVLALSAAAPAGALATEPDQERPGEAAPGQVGNGDAANDPAADPGGTTTDVPSADDVPPTPVANEDATPLDPEPVVDTNALPPDARDEPAHANPRVTGLTSPASPPATPGAVQAPPPAPSPPAPTAPIADHEAQLQAQATKDSSRAAAARGREAARAALAPRTLRIASHVPAPAASRTAAATISVPPATTDTRGGAPVAGISGEVHIVRPGESLWSVARNLLGGESSPAGVAREVHRLWELNKSRIGTGDPDLLMVGTRLRLR
jgi:hypothetical protein